MRVIDEYVVYHPTDPEFDPPYEYLRSVVVFDDQSFWEFKLDPNGFYYHFTHFEEFVIDALANLGVQDVSLHLYFGNRIVGVC